MRFAYPGYVYAVRRQSRRFCVARIRPQAASGAAATPDGAEAPFPDALRLSGLRIRGQAPIPQVLRSPDKAEGRTRGRCGTRGRCASIPGCASLIRATCRTFAPIADPRHSRAHPQSLDDAMHPSVTRALPLLLATFLATAAPAPAQSPAPPAHAGPTAETVLTARRIHTLDASQPQATAIAWDRDGRIVATGTAAELRHRFPQARHVDAGDATVIPGLIDAHAHVMELGYALLRADLSG